MKEFNGSIRVYYEDTDAAGVVYHTSYLKFMARTRTEWLRACGFSQESMRQEQGIIFVVNQINIKFMQPARFDELLDVNATLVKIGGASLRFRQSISNQKSIKLCDADINVACLDAMTLKPRRLPSTLRAELNNDD